MKPLHARFDIPTQRFNKYAAAGLILLLALWTRPAAVSAEDEFVRAGVALSRIQEVVTAVQQDYLFGLDLPRSLSAALAAAQSAAGEHPSSESSRRHLSWMAFEMHFRALAWRHPERLDAVRLETIRAFVESLSDPYTNYLTADEKKMLEAQQNHHTFTGIGVEVAPCTHGLRVVASLEGSPARSAGLRAGDEILLADGKTLGGLGLYRASDALLGPMDSTVLLVVRTADGWTHHVSVRRGSLRIPPVQSRMLDPTPHGGVGYIRVFIFGPDTDREAREELEKLDHHGAKSYILDLRDNPGGTLKSALGVAAMFAPGRILVRVMGKGSREEVRTAAGRVRNDRKPMVVLINGGTASSSEVVAGALDDYGIADLVGQRSFGKGLIQTLVPLADGAVLRVTTARYRTPAGRDIHGKGLTPDVPCYTTEGDYAIYRALQHLQRQHTSSWR